MEEKIPRTAIERFLREHWGKGPGMQKVLPTFEKCINEFVAMLSAEANEICNNEGKKMINHKHVLSALGKLGFDYYEKELNEFMAVCEKEDTQLPTKKKKKEEPTEDMILEQQKLFKQASVSAEPEQQLKPQNRQIDIEEENFD